MAASFDDPAGARLRDETDSCAVMCGLRCPAAATAASQVPADTSHNVEPIREAMPFHNDAETCAMKEG